MCLRSIVVFEGEEKDEKINGKLTGRKRRRLRARGVNAQYGVRVDVAPSCGKCQLSQLICAMIWMSSGSE